MSDSASKAGQWRPDDDRCRVLVVGYTPGDDATAQFDNLLDEIAESDVQPHLQVSTIDYEDFNDTWELINDRWPTPGPFGGDGDE